MKKGAIYARVSTEKQEEQRTIESQLAELRRLCANHDVEIVNEYIDDGYSGATIVRPALDKLRDDAPKGLFEVVYILSPDRLARKYLVQLLVMEELRKLGIAIMFLDKPVTDKPEDQLMLGIQGVISEYERNRIVDRSRRGKLHRAQNGEFMGGEAPYGYDYVLKSKDTPAHIKVNEEEAEVVRLIFTLYLDGMSSTSIPKELLRRKIKARKGSATWQQAVVHRMIINETYIGTAYYNKCEGHGNGKMRDREEWIPVKVPAIIDPETFRLAQEISRSRRRTLVKKRVYILSGLLRCKYCGSRYSSTWHTGSYGYYRCMNFAKMRPLPKTCKARAVRADRIEPAVVRAISEAILNPQIFHEKLLAMANQLQERARGSAQEKARLIGRRNQLKQKVQTLLDLYLDRQVSKSEYSEKKSEFDGKLEELDRMIEECSRNIPAIDEELVVKSVDHFVNKAREILGDFGPEKTQAFLRFLFDEMTYDWKERVVRLSGHVPTFGTQALSFQYSGTTMEERLNKNLGLFELEVTVCPPIS